MIKVLYDTETGVVTAWRTTRHEAREPRPNETAILVDSLPDKPNTKVGDYVVNDGQVELSADYVDPVTIESEFDQLRKRVDELEKTR